MFEKGRDVKNQLAASGNPYLLQHADNPVDWHEWSPETFEKAASEDKPVFLSIGYSTCHWCHVMERESFSDPEVAALMNETFVCIKVDREERPDIDQVYMTVCQLLTGSGGWPLTVILTPDQNPFFAGTYFPRGDHPGRPGLLQLIPRIRELWMNQRQMVESSAREITEGIHVFLTPDPESTPDRNTGKMVFKTLVSQYDSDHGGFRTAPKFPVFTYLLFLLRYWARTGEKRALAMIRQSLDTMRLGGIYDHLGYGFHRYSTDEKWFAPHFEKMLYDQALAAMAYSEAYCATAEDRYQWVAREVITYVLRDLKHPDGGFYSAEDADSEGEEGRFYTWSTEELEGVLDDEEMSLVKEIYNAVPEGNFHTEMGQPTGRNILYLSSGGGAPEISPVTSGREMALSRIREKLMASRELRNRPMRDEKVMTDWNGLMIAALSRAASAFTEPSYAETAERALAFILESGRAAGSPLKHLSYDGGEPVQAFLDDYAFLIWGILELHQFTQRPDLLREALRLSGEMVELFGDRENGGFFLTAGEAGQLLHRPKPSFDGPLPSGNSVAAMNLLRLGRLTGKRDLEDLARRTFRAFAQDMLANPGGFTHMAGAFEMERLGSTEVVIVGEPEAGETKQLISRLRNVYLPRVTFVVVDPLDPGMGGLIPHAKDMKTVDGKAAAYICRNFVCLAPTTDPEKMLQILSEEQGGVNS